MKGMQFKSLPRRSYLHTKTVVNAKKCVKDRLSLLAGTTMNRYKFNLVFVGKIKNSCALKGVDRASLTVHYYHSLSAWMTMEIFEHW